jgi:hypothetical protein
MCPGQVTAVMDGEKPLDFGRPSDWSTGLSDRVLRRELRVIEMSFTVGAPSSSHSKGFLVLVCMVILS